MKKKDENYSVHLIIGLALTLVVLIAMSAYWLGESTRLAEAADALSDDRVSHGRTIYAAQCVSCHGAQGEGGVGPALNNRTVLKNTLDEVYFSVIRSGVPSTQMPAWSVDYGGPLTDEDVRSVVAFIRAWEPTAPEVLPVVFTPSAERGALLFSDVCTACHGENGLGGQAGAINDAARLAQVDDDLYREIVRNGKPALGMPAWGAVLTSDQVEDLVALAAAWRQGQEVAVPYNVTDEIAGAVFSLQQNDTESAALRVERALSVASGPAVEVLANAQVQLTGGDFAGALATLEALKEQWPIGDAVIGGEAYAEQCANCHGDAGEGKAGLGLPLNPSQFVQDNTNAALVQFVLDGRPGTAMSGFKGRLTEAEIANIIAILRTWNP